MPAQPSGEDVPLRRLAAAAMDAARVETDALAALPHASSPAGHVMRAMIEGIELGLIDRLGELDEMQPRAPEPSG